MNSGVANATKIELKNPEALNFSGRETELSKLIGILSARDGSATLLSGDRGSGKTSTIKEAIRKVEKARENKRLTRPFDFGLKTRKYIVQLDVPLVSTYTANNELRKDVLRLMVQSLVSDYHSSSLAGRLRFPIGYKKKLNHLERSLLYKKITLQRNVGIKGVYSKIAAEASGAMQYEYDLAYADIELGLKDFFTKFSKYLEFIVVFDELDKYIGDKTEGANIRPHHYIRELKNLFTVTHAKFIFTSTENYYQEVNEELSSNSLELGHYKFSLFTHKILLNQLEPRDYTDFLKGMFKSSFANFTPLAAQEYRLFEKQMMWNTNCYPFLTKKKISELAEYRSDGSRYIELLNVNEHFLTAHTKVPALQYILNEVYVQHTTRNELTNRYLYKSLKKVADVLYSGRRVVTHSLNFYGIIFLDVEFDDPKSRRVFLNNEFNPNLNITFMSTDEDRWEALLDKTDMGVKGLVNNAVTDFIRYLDNLEIIETDTSDTSLSEVSLQLAQVKDNELEDVINSFDKVDHSVPDLTSKLVRKFNKAIAIVRYTGVDIAPMASWVEEADGGTLNMKGPLLTGFIRKAIEEIDLYMKEIQLRAGNKLVEEIERDFKKYSTKSIDMEKSNKTTLPVISLKLKIDSKNIEVLMNPDKNMIQSRIKDSSFAKTIIIFNAAKKQRSVIKNRTKLKYFYLNDRYSNFNSIIGEVKLYLHSQKH